MDSKEITLKEIASQDKDPMANAFEYIEDSAECSQKYIREDIALKAMGVYASNCMIEVLRWYMNDSFDQKHADKYVDRFLASDYFKELQK